MTFVRTWRWDLIFSPERRPRWRTIESVPDKPKIEYKGWTFFYEGSPGSPPRHLVPVSIFVVSTRVNEESRDVFGTSHSSSVSRSSGLWLWHTGRETRTKSISETLMFYRDLITKSLQKDVVLVDFPTKLADDPRWRFHRLSHPDSFRTLTCKNCSGVHYVHPSYWPNKNTNGRRKTVTFPLSVS